MYQILIYLLDVFWMKSTLIYNYSMRHVKISGGGSPLGFECVQFVVDDPPSESSGVI